MAIKRKLNYGRKRIILDYEKVDETNIVEVLQKALKVHEENRKDCEYLIKYFLGEQDILNSPPAYASDINNKNVFNYAFSIVREIVGYTFGSAVQLVQRDLDKQEDTKKLAEYYEYENDYYVDMCTAIYASICGLAYQITLPSADITADETPEVPITYGYLDPRETFVVLANSITTPQILSWHIIINNDGSKTYECYTNNQKIVLSNKKAFNTITVEDMEITTNAIGLNPITMVENSIFLTGDFEQAISVLNATNQINSDAINDVEMIVKSLLVIIGAEFEDDDAVKKVKENRILTLTKNTTAGGNIDAKFISPDLSKAGIEELRQYLDDARNIITGIPDRKTQSTGGDTGVAVLNRDGWTDIEIVARMKEMFFKKAKKKQIAVAIKILQNLDLISKDFTALDVTPLIGRHTTDNLLTKTQALATLVGTGILADIDSLELSGLTNKSRELIERGKQEYDTKVSEGKIVPENTETTPTDATNTNSTTTV